MSTAIPDGDASAARPLTLVVVDAGVSDPSSSRLLADRIAHRAVTALGESGRTATTRSVALGPLAVDIARAIVSGHPGESLRAAIGELAAADGVITSTPVYTAGVSGLFKSFFDVLDGDLVVAKPVLLAATAGSPRHALVVEDQVRPMFAYLRALSVPTSVFAAPEDWGASALGDRIGRAAVELAALMASGVGDTIADRAWSGYRHRFDGNATRAEHTAADVDFDTPLMRLAAGGAPLRKNASSGS
ncbi:CE1759 family FMN reductase [Actinacidiphila glaucinigra]|uniref:CE1759 family FMN reductase n=1 Tax=Actinacidiphila glaucinigra TaxID=235986 RepID=UPI002DDB71F8|nr:CE1759 family FMN reductase [Actinacidiphila glaucinigra]WSD58266.1 NAD(P)H-dependent oxidoreductase [Actinacidiphila glaucinigra]